MIAKMNLIGLSANCNSTAEPMFNWATLFALVYCLVLTPNASFAAKNIAPVARIITTSTMGVAPFTTTFDGSKSTDKDGTITAYNWNFGDGSTATGATTSHTFNTVGDYTVSLSVTDNKGATGTASTSISVIIPPPPSAMGNRPTGIYSINRVTNLPYVSGVVIRVLWSELEPSEGVYDFSKIEKTVRDAVLIGQSVTIANGVWSEPAWLMNKVSEANKYQGIWDADIVPWDETMLLAMERLAQAESNFMVDGMALKGHPNVKQVDAPVGTANGIRLINIPANYTPELYKDGVTRSVQIWADAYPNKHLYTGLFGVNDGTRTTSTTISTAESIRNDLLQEFNGVDKPKLNIFIDYWTGQRPVIDSPLLSPIKDQTSIMMQSCGSWSGQDSIWAQCSWLEPLDRPELGFNYAMSNFNTTYFEVYPDDLTNPAYTSQFEEAEVRIEELAATLN